jgi:gamma-glutamylcyclotransferase
MLYFAYGSNMCTGRLRAPDRVPTAEFVRIARVPQHLLRFHKLSKKDCSAKADAYLTGYATPSTESGVLTPRGQNATPHVPGG